MSAHKKIRLKMKRQQLQQLEQEQQQQQELEQQQMEQMEQEELEQHKEHELDQESELDERIKMEDRSSGSTMELRKYRKITAKRRSLERSSSSSAAEPASKMVKLNLREESEAEEEGEEAKPIKQEMPEEVSESSTMTLERFTEIVLESEGLSGPKKEAKDAVVVKKESEEEEKPRPSPMPTPSPAPSPTHASAVAATLMQNNNDLVVSVKPLRPPKPVVLTPRQPPGSHLLHHRHTANPSLASSVVVSVKPRVHPVLPPNKPPSVPKLVEEWFSKMQPPLSETAPPGCLAAEALNLSTKPPELTAVSSQTVLSKTTQVYLRPITNPPKTLPSPTSLAPSVTISPRPPVKTTSGVAGSTSSTSSARNSRLVQLPRNQYSPDSQGRHSSSASSTAASPSPPHKLQAPPSPKLLLSSPPPPTASRLEIRKVERPATATTSAALSKKVGRAVPFESNGGHHMENVKARALRDVQLALIKDIHGNYPIHMSVLMRKPELVRRYCCVLQVLESSIDLLNEEKMSPLHLAVRDHSYDIVDILLSFGADPLVKDRRGNSSLHIATAAKAPKILNRLVKSTKTKEDLNQFNEYGVTSLHVATLNNDSLCAEILTNHGADPSIPDSVQGLTPIAMAKRGKLDRIVGNIPKKSNVEIPSR